MKPSKSNYVKWQRLSLNVIYLSCEMHLRSFCQNAVSLPIQQSQQFILQLAQTTAAAEAAQVPDNKCNSDTYRVLLRSTSLY